MTLETSLLIKVWQRVMYFVMCFAYMSGGRDWPLFPSLHIVVLHHATPSLTHTLTQLTHSLTYSLTRVLTLIAYSLTHSLTHSDSLSLMQKMYRDSTGV
jgi:hypothetical protein